MKRDCPVAIIGMGCLFPGSPDKESYWRTITAKKNLITPVPPSHFLVEQYYDPDPKAPDRTYCRQGGFLDPVAFDPIAFNIPPANLDSIDTSQLLSLVVARQVIEEAFAGQLKNMDRSRIGVVLGVAAGLELLAEMAGRLERPIWIKAMREAGLPENEIKKISNTILSSHAPWKENTFPGLLGNIVAGRIAQFFDLGGINCTNDAACASSFSALSQALYELYQGSSDVVITGGADTNNGPFLFVSFSKTPALSPTHDCRPFSDKAAALLESIIQNHPFIDGNKRTALIAAGGFLERNGWILLYDVADVVSFALGVANKQIAMPEIVAWLRAHSHPYATEP